MQYLRVEPAADKATSQGGKRVYDGGGGGDCAAACSTRVALPGSIFVFKILDAPINKLWCKNGIELLWLL